MTGYKTNLSSTIKANFKVEQDLGMLIDGLKFTGLFRSQELYCFNCANETSKYNGYEISEYDPDTQEFSLRRLGKENTTEINTKGGHGGDCKIYMQAILITIIPLTMYMP